MVSADVLINAVITLLVTIDPIGNTPLFIGLTAGLAASDRRATALRAVLVAFAVLVLFAITGTGILDAMGITIDAFRVAGGLLLFYTAFEMIYAQRQARREQVSEAALRDHIANLAVFPLAIPLIAGPGTISATILLSNELTAAAGSAWAGRAMLVGVIAALMLVTGIALSLAEYLDKLIGATGRLVMTRLLGVLLAALSVQYVADGVKALF